VVNITVNNRPVRVKAGQTLLEALCCEGIRVPTLCHLKDMSPTGACRLCVVEVEGQRGLVPSCAFPVQEGMRVNTHSERAISARRTIVELLLSSHPDDCLYCVRNGCCDLQDLAVDLGVRERRFKGAMNDHHVDISSPSIVRDPAKCILCGRCVRVCEEVQAVGAIDFIGRGSRTRVGTAFDRGLNVSSCVNCGQCVAVCPTGALRERSHLKEVVAALADPGKLVVVQHAPAVSVTLAEEFGMPAGKDICGVMTAAMRLLGFGRVFDTSFAADLTIMEEGSELVSRIKSGGALPMMTSCSPGWIKFIEQFYPEFLPNVSSCKSPQQMLGAVIKTYFAQQEGVDPADIFSVSVMPCTAKKFEAERPEMGRNGVRDVDAVLTTRELARLIRQRGIDIGSLSPEPAHSPLGERTTAGKLFGVSGGVMEAAIRTAHVLVTGEELGEVSLRQIRGIRGVKGANVTLDGLELGVAVVNGLGNARALMEELRAGRDDLHFIEVMTCPGGCIGGGGQPIGADSDALKARMRTLYRIDRDEPVRRSHENGSVKRLYEEFLGEPLGEKSHELLHTRYAGREVIV
jgi:iron-only hydrogenase group A